MSRGVCGSGRAPLPSEWAPETMPLSTAARIGARDAPRAIMASSRRLGPRCLSMPLRAVLLVRHFLHPVDGLAVELFLNGDVRHEGGGRRAVPVLLARREPDHVAGTDLLDRAALALHPAATGRDD